MLMMENISKRRGAYMPYWNKQGAIYTVCFRLQDSLPATKRLALDLERREIEQKQHLSQCEQSRLKYLYSNNIESLLDNGYGECFLGKAEIAKIMMETMQCKDNDHYQLLAWCIMPNHVHVLLKPLQGRALSQILRAWKTISARKANLTLNRSGPFWQSEYYNRIIRNDAALQRWISYIWSNPDRAGLTDWPWRWKRIYDHVSEDT